ncbi:hypothetical protein [Acinetobacter sp. ANC 4639]
MASCEAEAQELLEQFHDHIQQKIGNLQRNCQTLTD